MAERREPAPSKPTKTELIEEEEDRIENAKLWAELSIKLVPILAKEAERAAASATEAAESITGGRRTKKTEKVLSPADASPKPKARAKKTTKISDTSKRSFSTSFPRSSENLSAGARASLGGVVTQPPKYKSSGSTGAPVPENTAANVIAYAHFLRDQKIAQKPNKAEWIDIEKFLVSLRQNDIKRKERGGLSVALPGAFPRSVAKALEKGCALNNAHQVVEQAVLKEKEGAERAATAA